MRRSRNGLMGILGILCVLGVLSIIPTSCRIEPPLHLPKEDVTIKLPIVQVDMETVWDIDADWQTQWWYGWDDRDIEIWGKLEYPDAAYFEIRQFYKGEDNTDDFLNVDGFTIYGKSYRRHYYYGYYNLLIWSNIDSPDGTQTILIDERDYNNILASTTKTSVSYAKAPSRVVPLKNQPDIFYNTHERDIYISPNIEDYDYFDETEKSWVKKIKATLTPVVYIYLVQVVIYNNNGKITGLADNATMTNMSEGVNLNSGRTLLSNVDIVYSMRMKNDLPARNGKMADILGSKLTTFGLCDMEPWSSTRGPQYAGSRADLTNEVLLNLQFNNATDTVYTYDVTRQLQRQAHGGIITIEIDADTITVPQTATPSSSGFRPTVEEPDTIVHDFNV